MVYVFRFISFALKVFYKTDLCKTFSTVGPIKKKPIFTQRTIGHKNIYIKKDIDGLYVYWFILFVVEIGLRLSVIPVNGWDWKLKKKKNQFSISIIN